MNFALSKTPKGLQEIAKRGLGLDLKMRQLLILIDGKRSIDELEKMMPSINVPAAVELLVNEGLIQEQQGASAPASTINSQPATKTVAPAAAVGVAVNAQNPQEVIRRTAKLVTDTLGPNANDFALRIERCQSVDELRELVPQMFAVVEGVLGTRALADFTRRLGVL